MEVLVTGGDTDLGRTVAESFRDAGHRVVIAGARRDLQTALDLEPGSWAIRIHKKPNRSRRRQKFTQQPKSLWPQYTDHDIHSGGVPARPGQAIDETKADRVR